jgi:hypothetical protein
MKLLATALFVISTAINPAALAQNADQSQATFNFNQQNLSINLEQKDFETIYRTDQVPDTCYRDEIQGTRQECHTEYDNQCETRYEQQCAYRNYPVCQTVPRNVCRTEQQCTTQNDRVCQGTPPNQRCTNVPRRVCNPVQRCSTQMDQVCHTEQRYECQTVPRQYCQQIPRQVCVNVPNVVRVPYACTRPVQVPVGQQLKQSTVAKISLNLINFSEVGQLADALTAKLANGQVTFTAANAATNAYLYQVVAQQRTEQVISATEKVVNYVVTVKAISVQQLNSLLNSTVSSSKIALDHIEFAFNNFGAALPNIPLKGHLKVLQQKNSRTAYIIVNDDFTSKAIVSQGSNQIMMMNSFGVNSLVAGRLHTVELTIRADMSEINKNLINPDALVQVADKAIQATFQGTP